MKKSLVFAVVLLVLLFGSKCMALRSAVIGGARDGVALGLMLESGATDSATLRFGFEANTSNTPGIAFIGGKFFLTDISSRFPMFLSGGLVGYFGDRVEAGPYISVIFERFVDVMPLFLECGIDVVNSGRLQLQLGYYF